MKVKVLTDSNQAILNKRKRSCSSFYIETGSHRILFDLGSNNAFATNGNKLSVDISKVDTVVLSSGYEVLINRKYKILCERKGSVQRRYILP